jgi:hypothetical protein
MAFTLQIQCPTIEDAERILDVLRNNTAVLTDAGDQGSEPEQSPLPASAELAGECGDIG